MPTTDHDEKIADGALLGLTFMEAIAAKDKEMRSLIFASYPSEAEGMAGVLFSVSAAFDFLLAREAARSDMTKHEYVQSLRGDYLDYAEHLRGE